jgi:hypothetical protein
MKFDTLIQCTVIFAASFLQIEPAIAKECLADRDTNQAYQVGKNTSWAISIQQASKTFQDWIWRGDTFRCNSVSGVAAPCTYTWTKSRSNGYTVSGCAALEANNIPVIGGALDLIHLDASYGRTVTNTESTGWSQQVPGGKYATFVEVVVRRWTQGVFQGMDQNTGQKCSIDDSGTGSYWIPGHYYDWNGSARYCNWTANEAINGTDSAYGMVWIHN